MKFYRSIVRIERIEKDAVFVVFSGWDPRAIVEIPLAEIPRSIQEKIKPDERFFVEMTLGAETKEEIVIDHKTWEIPVAGLYKFKDERFN